MYNWTTKNWIQLLPFIAEKGLGVEYTLYCGLNSPAVSLKVDFIPDVQSKALEVDKMKLQQIHSDNTKKLEYIKNMARLCFPDSKKEPTKLVVSDSKCTP